MTSIKLDLHYVDELIDQRRLLHGGYQGAPPVIDGYRQGESLNRSIVLMLSAQLQTYVEDVFFKCSSQILPLVAPNLDIYKKSFGRWGNPSADNINTLFTRLGASKILDGLSWQGTTTARISKRLAHLNQLRNDIAHGKKILKIDGVHYTLTLSEAEKYRRFSERFAERFEEHAIGILTAI